MRVVFGIDVSKVSSEVAILVNGEKVHNITTPCPMMPLAFLGYLAI